MGCAREWVLGSFDFDSSDLALFLVQVVEVGIVVVALNFIIPLCSSGHLLIHGHKYVGLCVYCPDVRQSFNIHLLIYISIANTFILKCMASSAASGHIGQPL